MFRVIDENAVDSAVGKFRQFFILQRRQAETLGEMAVFPVLVLYYRIGNCVHQGIIR